MASIIVTILAKKRKLILRTLKKLKSALKMNGEKFMKKTKNKIKKTSLLKVKPSSVEEFFSTVETVMRSADKKESIKPRIKTLSFEDPMEMLHFLSTAKLKLIQRIRQQPDSITNIAKAV